MVDSTLFSLATLNAHPAMNPDSVIQGDHWLIGLITDALVRFEWSDSGRFVDDATQMAMVRDFGEKPEFTVTERNGWQSTPRRCISPTTSASSLRKACTQPSSTSTPSKTLGITATCSAGTSAAPTVRSTRRTAASPSIRASTAPTVGRSSTIPSRTSSAKPPK